MKPRRPILRLRNAPSSGERRTNAHNAYLPEGGEDRTVTPLQSHETSTFGDSRTVTGNEGCNGSESAQTPAKQGTVTVQRFGNPGAGRETAASALPGTAPSMPAPARPAFGWVPAAVTWRERMAAEVEALAGGHAPAVFGPLRSGGPWMPFTCGLRDAFMACYPEADECRVRRLFARVCASDGYLRALAREGARRHDLDGVPLGPVSDAHRTRAAQQLEARRAKRAKGGRA